MSAGQSKLYPSVAAERMFSPVDSGGLTLRLDLQRYGSLDGEAVSVKGEGESKVCLSAALTPCLLGVPVTV